MRRCTRCGNKAQSLTRVGARDRFCISCYAQYRLRSGKHYRLNCEVGLKATSHGRTMGMIIVR